MYRQDTDETQAPFLDASFCFTDEDWKLLQEWQKELCGNVMKEIHQAMISLGPLIASTAFSLRAKGKPKLQSVDNHQPKRSLSVKGSTIGLITNPDELLSIKRGEGVPSNNPLEIEEIEIYDSLGKEEPATIFIDLHGEEVKGSNSNSGVTFITDTFSINTKPEKEPCVQGTINPEKPTSDLSNSEAVFVKESSTCYESKNFIQSTLNQCQIIKIDDNLTFSPDYKKAVRGNGKVLQRQIYQTRKKAFSCSDCGKSFIQKLGLQRHQRIHTSEKPFPCNMCGKSFVYKADLHCHQRIHTGEKPFSCTECGKNFNEHKGLKRHQISHKGEKPFPCTECGKSFVYKADLYRHQRIHTGEKPFPCTKCGKRFTQMSILQRHQTVHMGEKPFPCSECGKGFTRKAILLHHQKIHKGEKPFS